MIGQPCHDIEYAGGKHQEPETNADDKARPHDGTDYGSTSIDTPGPRNQAGISICKDVKTGGKRKTEEEGEHR